MNAQVAAQTQTAKPTFTPPVHGLLQRCTATTECDECRKKRLGTLQRAAIDSSTTNEIPPIVHEVLRSPGQPLDSQTRAFMEPRFWHNFSRVPVGSQAKLTIGPQGDQYEREADTAADRVTQDHMPSWGPRHDFSQVRVHTDNKAADSAHAMNALAYTVGSDVVFARGQYEPSTPVGQRLLAHELSHVIQQSAGDAPRVQRQFEIPVFDEFDPCIIDPIFGKQICGSYAKTLCEKVPSLPGCSAVCRKLGCKTPEKASLTCPPGFRPGRSTAFKGQCCVEKLIKKPDRTTEDQTIESASNCCPASLAASTVLGPRCCPVDTVASQGECIKGTEGPLPGPTPGPIGPRPTPPAKMVLHFNLDQPAVGSDASQDNLLRSLTTADQSAWHELLNQLRSNPSWRFQLVGKASPEGTPPYNLDLATRRAQLIKQALVDGGIERRRIVDIEPECKKVETGVYSCGETGGTGPEDRHVKLVFDLAGEAVP